MFNRVGVLCREVVHNKELKIMTETNIGTHNTGAVRRLVHVSAVQTMVDYGSIRQLKS